MNLYGKLVNIQTGESIKYFDSIEEVKAWFWCAEYQIKQANSSIIPFINPYKQDTHSRVHIAYLFDFCPYG